MRTILTSVITLLLLLVTSLGASCGQQQGDDEMGWPQFLLAAGITYYLIVQQDDSSTEDDNGTETASLTVINNTGADVRIWIDGEDSGTVLNGSQRMWNVTPDTHTVEYGYAAVGEPTYSEAMDFSERNLELILYPTA